jgi:O-antigen ligase
LILLCAVLTGSRGGQLVFLAVLAAYFVNRVGLVGLVLGGVLALPLLLLGGRSSADASSSTMERVDCWAEALGMWREHPALGVGFGRFTEYHYMTAHNSYLLALAELGLPGMLLFGLIVYSSAKIPWVVLNHGRGTSDPELRAGTPLMRAWAMALLAAFVGLSVGVFFLTFTYLYVLGIYLGLSGALYSAVRRHDPNFRVRIGWRDFAIVSLACAAIIAVVYLYARWKLG